MKLKAKAKETIVEIVKEFKDIAFSHMAESKAKRVAAVLDRTKDIKKLYGDKYTVIVLKVDYYEAIGRARLTEEDEYDKERGISIALFRAVERVEKNDRKQKPRKR